MPSPRIQSTSPLPSRHAVRGGARELLNNHMVLLHEWKFEGCIWK